MTAPAPARPSKFDAKARVAQIQSLGKGHEPDDRGGDGHPVPVAGCPFCIPDTIVDNVGALLECVDPRHGQLGNAVRVLLASQMLDLAQAQYGRQ
jgi:hypothetical protein